MFINTFRYTPEDVDCRLCTAFTRKDGCTAPRCLYLATMRKLKQTLTRHPRISRRTRLAIRLQLHRRHP